MKNTTSWKRNEDGWSIQKFTTMENIQRFNGKQLKKRCSETIVSLLTFLDPIVFIMSGVNFILVNCWLKLPVWLMIALLLKVSSYKNYISKWMLYIAKINCVVIVNYLIWSLCDDWTRWRVWMLYWLCNDKLISLSITLYTV